MSIPSARSVRIASLLKLEISKIIQNRIRNKDVGFATIVELVISNDLSVAKIYISVYGNDKHKTLKALQKSVGYIRKEIAKNLNLRIVPDLVFYLDDRLERGDRVLSLLNSINKNVR